MGMDGMDGCNWANSYLYGNSLQTIGLKMFHMLSLRFSSIHTKCLCHICNISWIRWVDTLQISLSICYFSEPVVFTSHSWANAYSYGNSLQTVQLHKLHMLSLRIRRWLKWLVNKVKTAFFEENTAWTSWVLHPVWGWMACRIDWSKWLKRLVNQAKTSFVRKIKCERAEFCIQNGDGWHAELTEAGG